MNVQSMAFLTALLASAVCCPRSEPECSFGNQSDVLSQGRLFDRDLNEHPDDCCDYVHHSDEAGAGPLERSAPVLSG